MMMMNDKAGPKEKTRRYILDHIFYTECLVVKKRRVMTLR